MSAPWWRSILRMRAPSASQRRRASRRLRRFRPLLEILEDRSLPSTLLPATFADTNVANPASAQFSLRGAIILANADSQDDVIQLAAGTYSLTRTGASEDASATGDLDVTKSAGTLTIKGAGSGLTVLDASSLGDRVLQVFAGANVVLSGVTLRGGQANGNGGGIANAGTLTIQESTVSGNTALAQHSSDRGGGIYNTGTLTVSDSTLSANHAGAPGAGFASRGGGIASSGTLNLTNVTVAGNDANDQGGGLEITGGTATLQNVTITGNNADSDNFGGGPGGGLRVAGGTATLTNTLVAGNTRSGEGSDDVTGTLDSDSSFNLIGDGTGLSGVTNGSNGNQVGSGNSPIDPQLTPVQNEGRPDTYALLPGSPAIDAGTSSGAPETDERGAPRSGAVDIGAYEYNPPAFVGLSPEALAYTEHDPPTPIDPGATVTDADNTDFAGGTLTVDFASGGTADDRLGLPDQGTGEGQVGVSGSTVTFSGAVIGTLSGAGTGVLVVTFNATADAGAVQAVLRDVTYFNASDNPAATRTVRFVLTDGDGGTSNPATRVITVTPVNDAPVAQPGSASGDEDTVISGIAVATDVDSPTLTYSLVSGPASGSVVVNPDGTFSYTPNANFNGTDSFTFQASDGALASNTATVTITVTPVNDAPVAQDGSASGDEDTVITGTAVATDIDSPTLTYALVSGPQHGAVVVNSNGSFSYTPDADYNGADSFTFQASDGALASNAATVTITVNPVNDAPVLNSAASPALAPVAEDTPDNGTRVADLIASVSPQVLITDPDAGALQGIAVTGVDGAHGTWQFSTDGGGTWADFGAVSDASARLLAADALTRIRFVPAPDFNGVVAGGLTFRAWDQTSGTNGGTADTSENGGPTAFSTGVATASVTVTPQPATHFRVTVSGEAVAGQPVSVTVTALDRYDTLANSYTGTVRLGSSDGAASLPGPFTFTAADAGSHTFLVTLFTAGAQTVTAQDTADGALQGGASVPVTDVPPANVSLNLSAAALDEGQSLALSGSFTAPGPQDTYTVVIQWGDGSPDTSFSLPAGARTFSAEHRYTDDNPTGTAADANEVRVTVTDNHGGAGGAAAAVTVRNVAPAVSAGPLSFLGIGVLFTGSGSFTDPGEDTWSATVDYGDGAGPQPLELNPDHTFALSHLYDREGSFTVTVSVTDDDGGTGSVSFFVNTFVAGPEQAAIAVAGPGQTVTASVAGITITLERSAEGTGLGAVVGALLPSGEVAAALPDADLLGASPAAQRLVTYDVRAINLSALDRATLTFEVESPDGHPPTLRVLDAATHALREVFGSRLVPGSLTVTQVPGTTRFRIRVVFDGTSDPELTDLTGTIFTVSIPLEQPPAPLTPAPTVVVSAAPPRGAAVDAGSEIALPFERTGFVSGSQRTLATTPPENPLTNFGAGGPDAPRPSDLALAQEVLSAAHSGFWDPAADAGGAAAANPQPPENSALPEEEEEALALPDILTRLFAEADAETFALPLAVPQAEGDGFAFPWAGTDLARPRTRPADESLPARGGPEAGAALALAVAGWAGLRLSPSEAARVLASTGRGPRSAGRWLRFRSEC
jgi:large repetitive protein